MIENSNFDYNKITQIITTDFKAKILYKCRLLYYVRHVT